MRIAPFRLTGRGSGLLVMSISVLALAACSAPAAKVAGGKQRSKEYFSEREYGVKASPRVTNQRTRLPRGGGRDQVGKPYMVKGQWYHPKEEPGYRKSGIASWYGDAFHGRLTANGEIYDMTHLTAAHPTMPLPSYARVTNKKNGSSVIVRVNDRGPYAHGRVIDLSRKAAELLDYTHSGVAKVEVEYIGRAPLHGRDDEYLMASYRPAGGRGPDPSDGLPTGVMIAMSGPTPTRGLAGAGVPFPVQPRAAEPFEVASAEFVLPDFGPFVPERPTILARRDGGASSPALSYADTRVAQAASAVAGLAGAQAGTDDLVAALNRRYAGKMETKATAPGYVAVGTYADEASAQDMAARLRDAGQGLIETDWRGEAFTLTIRPTAGRSLDAVLQAAWAAGAADAMPIRE